MSPSLDPRVDAYIEAAPDFARPILEKVRRAFHRGCPGLTETMKWSRPAFEFHGILGGMSAFKAHASWTLWRGKDLDDPAGILEGVGEKAAMSQGRVETAKDLPTQAVMVEYVRRAAALNARLNARLNAQAETSKKAARRPAPKTPQDLAAALKKNKQARLTFEGFPPSHKREYVQWITEAKRQETRDRRLEQAVEWLAEGKSRNWKYEAC